jgi:hypothetical protein
MGLMGSQIYKMKIDNVTLPLSFLMYRTVDESIFKENIQDIMNRSSMIETIYDNRKANYTDLRSFTTRKSIVSRLVKIRSLGKKIPENKRNSKNTMYKRLTLERSLIFIKLALVYGKELPLVLTLDKFLIESHNKVQGDEKESQETKENRKKLTTLILLRCLLHPKSDEQLLKIIEGQRDENEDVGITL